MLLLFCSPCERFFATGVVTSPNYPDSYPNNLHKTEMIRVDEGLILLLQFTTFNVEPHSTCDYDHLTITDDDGTILMEKSCGSAIDGTLVIGGLGGLDSSLGSFVPANIRSLSNSVNLIFKTDFTGAMAGWSVSWSAVTPGECKNIFLDNFGTPLD